MPYKVFKVEGGWKVGKVDEEGKRIKMSNGRNYASNKPLTKKNATAQMKAMYANEKN